MLILKYILATTFLISLSYSIAANNRDPFVIQSNQSHLIDFTLQYPTRVTIIQYYGSASFKIKVNEKIIYQSNPSFTQI